MSNLQSLSLVKNESFDLTKENPGVAKFTFAGGWDVVGAGADFDLDIFAIALRNGKLTGTSQSDILKDICYFGNMSVHGFKLDKDNRTGEGDGDDETMTMDLSAIPADIDVVILGINIYQGAEKNQRFSQVQNSFVRIFNPDTKAELCIFKLKEDFKRSTAVVAGRLDRKGAEWEFTALGEGVDGSILDVANKYK